MHGARIAHYRLRVRGDRREQRGSLGPGQPLCLEAADVAGRSGGPVNRRVANTAHRRIAAQSIVVRILLANEPSKLRSAEWGSQRTATPAGPSGGFPTRVRPPSTPPRRRRNLARLDANDAAAAPASGSRLTASLRPAGVAIAAATASQEVTGHPQTQERERSRLRHFRNLRDCEAAVVVGDRKPDGIGLRFWI
jgi:hypothetical protein